jgi:hypothetical protein
MPIYDNSALLGPEIARGNVYHFIITNDTLL